MTTMPIGSIVYLTSCVIKAKITAEATMPDCPDMYGAELELMDDRGAMDVSGLVGSPGPNGQAQFALRRQDDIRTDFISQLPDDLTDDLEDIGKYYIVATKDAQGTVTEQWAYVWCGMDTGYVKTFMGSSGPPGPVPRIRSTTELIDPALDAFVDTGGTTLAPSWQFNLNVARGEPGIPRALYDFPDYDNSPAPTTGMVLMCSEDYNDQGDSIWRPANLLALSPRVYSVPESAFSSHTGAFQAINPDESVSIANVIIPPQPFDWTPIVWGHIAGTNEGLFGLRDQRMRIGCSVSLGASRTVISRGYSTGVGQVNIMPHYSTGRRPTRSITPSNRWAMIQANHSDPADGTLHIELQNDGVFGFFDYYNTNSQLFIMVVPIDAYRSYARTTRRVQ